MKKSQKSGKKLARKLAKKLESTTSSKPRIMPLGDRVLIKEKKEDEGVRKTDSGIFIPDSVKEDKGTKRGKVVAVGEGRYENGKLIPIPLKSGDEVLFSWGDQITIDGEEYYLVRGTEISAVIK